MFFSRKAPIQKRRRRRKAVAIRICPSSNHVSCSESAIKIYGSKEEIRARKSPETVDAPDFAPDASIPVTLYGAVGGIRTLGRLLAVTRFPVVLVMTTSIPLRISMLNSKHHYTKIGREVNTQFSLFRKKETGKPSGSARRSFSYSSRSSAARAAICSASFLLCPSPRPTTAPLSRTSKVKVLSWSGPDSSAMR